MAIEKIDEPPTGFVSGLLGCPLIMMYAEHDFACRDLRFQIYLFVDTTPVLSGIKLLGGFSRLWRR